MASKAVASTALFLSLNLLFFTLVSSTHHLVPCPSPVATATCPRDTPRLGVCSKLLNDLLHLVVGTPQKKPCCPLIQGLADLEAAVCLCTVLKANVLGINLNVPIS
ncbi:hypothetical protein P3X46_003834 [Hevea brasiliensis]|uniref:Hydrophobic seed protein domain-containing protein n=1 Tax=Hevea brasiliensis TaxID=3981 RepID=A0ABQ9N888_HEVBR|nr:14 kDa proline-rich protein DC2.15 isoform X3 [Hevea brasiliensis]KAJ9188478.1 hypothetical protein P3X46_003834 [Hevea brasiliensis]